MPKKILLADDSITIQKVVELTFSDGDYEVTAVNNGAKAIAKLGEMRPDIILSDIIMPEKNGYEVCEFVKSHPDYRSIPVVLLTGTFEPFDPDRADKAGCDAVVTKPFESQSLIHKVEELIAQAKTSAPAAATPPMATTAFAPEPSFGFTPAPAPAFTPAPPSPPPPPAAAPEPFAHDADIFAAAPEAPSSTTEMPFETDAPAFGGETRAFPRMSFEDMQKMAGESVAPTPAPEPPPAEASPWDDAPAFGGETRAFPRMSFDDMQKMAGDPAATMAPAPAPPPPPAPEASPWDEPAPAFGGETRAFPAMSFDELQKMGTAPAAAPPTPPPAPPAEPEASPWDADEPAADQGTAQPAAFASEPEPSPWDSAPAAPEPEPAGSPFGNEAAFGGETRAFPRMSFDELQQMASAPAAAPQPMSAPEPEPEPAPWNAPGPVTEEEPAPMSAGAMEVPSADSFADSPSPFGESPFSNESSAPEAEPEPDMAAAAESYPTAVNSQITDEVAPTSAATTSSATGDLSDEQIERIARRVVQMLSDQVVRNIAWEVIPDLAEIVVKERIRQLEAEA
jgi:CheY-like chemotaxis protein